MKNYLRHFVVEIRSVVRDRWLILSVAVLGPAATGFWYVDRVGRWADNAFPDRSGFDFTLMLFPIFVFFAAHRIFADANAASADCLWRTWPVPVRIWAGARAVVAGIVLVAWPATVIAVAGEVVRGSYVGTQAFTAFAFCWLAMVFGVYGTVRNPVGRFGVMGVFVAGQIVVAVMLGLICRVFFGNTFALVKDSGGLIFAGWIYALILPVAIWRMLKSPVARIVTKTELAVIVLTIPAILLWPLRPWRFSEPAVLATVEDLSAKAAASDAGGRWRNIRNNTLKDDFREILFSFDGMPRINGGWNNVESAEYRILGESDAGDWTKLAGDVWRHSPGRLDFLNDPWAGFDWGALTDFGYGEPKADFSDTRKVRASLILPVKKHWWDKFPILSDVAGKKIEIRATLEVVCSDYRILVKADRTGDYDAGIGVSRVVKVHVEQPTASVPNRWRVNYTRATIHPLIMIGAPDIVQEKYDWMDVRLVAKDSGNEIRTVYSPWKTSGSGGALTTSITLDAPGSVIPARNQAVVILGVTRGEPRRVRLHLICDMSAVSGANN